MEHMEYLIRLYNLAVLRNNTLHFNRDDYKWVLGIKVVNELENRNEIYRSAIYPEQPTLFGIVVDVDFKNPDNIQLWENITNKL